MTVSDVTELSFLNNPRILIITHKRITDQHVTNYWPRCWRSGNV